MCIPNLIDARLRAFAVLTSLTLVSVAHGQKVVVGQPAPPLTLASVINGPDAKSVNWESLKGKVVLLEFWATWCAPCLEAIPHINALTSKYKGQEIVFVSITAETPEIIEWGLKRHPMSTWVAADDKSKTHTAYGITAIPRAIIVDKNGIVVADTHPTKVTEEIIDKALAGETISKPPIQPTKPAADTKPTRPVASPLYEIEISESRASRSGGGRGPGYLKQKRISLVDAFLFTSNVKSAARVIGAELAPPVLLDITAKSPIEQEALLRSQLSNSLCAMYGLKVSRVEREVETVVVYPTSDFGPNMIKSDPDGEQGHNSSRAGIIVGSHAALPALLALLERQLGLPIINESGLKDRYSFELRFPTESGSDAILKSVREQLGLNIQLETRVIEMLLIERVRD